MRPVNLTVATHRRARQEETAGPNEHDVGSSSHQGDPHANTQLAQQLAPRPPMRAARLRGPRRPLGVQIADFGMKVAHFGRMVASVPAAVFSVGALPAPFVAAYGYATDDAWLKNYANVSVSTALSFYPPMIGLYAVEYLAAWYLQAQAQAQEQASVPIAVRANELGMTETCLYAAIEMVSRLDADTPGPDMNEGERNALAMDLKNLVTEDRSRLPSDLWGAANGVGDDAYKLVSNLLEVARRRASAEASASTAG
ncbi:type III secretion system effector XopAV [Xanthomonas dyei]|uniref:type III secretion system effector XopAV n=1 Tax=Xanthomonas dyei TaxID=743699 RepID=UPI0032E8FB40